MRISVKKNLNKNSVYFAFMCWSLQPQSKKTFANSKLPSFNTKYYIHFQYTTTNWTDNLMGGRRGFILFHIPHTAY